jgi:hypothetical protein
MTLRHVIENVQPDYAEIYLLDDEDECHGIGYVWLEDVTVIDSLDPERYHMVKRWFCYEHDGCFLGRDVQEVTGYATREEALSKFMLDER